MKSINTNLSELAGGSLQERFDHAVAKVTENILDVNTDPKKKRKITITLTMGTVDEHRDEMVVSAEVKTTLAPREPVATRVLIEDYDGNIYANELKSGQRGQMFMDDDGSLKDDKGKAVEDIEKEEAANNGVVKFTGGQSKTN